MVVEYRVGLGGMARHSKWHKVRQFKGAIDAKRSASFTKLAREITVAAREKGADPEMNAGLRAAIDRARESSMPKENIERAIQRGVGSATEGTIESLTYEAYGPGGTALVIECLTDNRNRTASDVKHLLSKSGGSLAQSGAVTYLFARVGLVRVSLPMGSRAHVGESPLSSEVELACIDAGATDISPDDDGVDIYCAPQDLARLAQAVTDLGMRPHAVEFAWIPHALVDVDESIGLSVQELIEQLEAHDDVQRVSSNVA